jgi:serine/threonine-protein kinase
MGEVYRADDLKLGQIVALKFLPEDVENDEARRARFLDEVRIARQVSHSNVCRVYDVGDVDGRHFISMEFVDGEDLATLLRRIGRLPNDKAVQIARQLCAGLAAAHEQKVLHRDLKPGERDDRRTRERADHRLRPRGIRDGGRRDRPTAAARPRTWRPELLAGGGASVKSDVYALGLVLYELFTGHQPFPPVPRSRRARRATSKGSTPRWSASSCAA